MTDLVSLDSGDLDGSSSFRIIDMAGGLVPYQTITENEAGKAIFFAEEIPGLGFRQYRLLPTQNPPQFSTGIFIFVRQVFRNSAQIIHL